KAGGDAWVTDVHLAHDAARAPPRPGLGARRVHACALVPTALRGALGLRAHLPGSRLHEGVPGPAGDSTAGRLGLEPRPHLGRGQGAVTAPAQEGRRPGWPQPFAEPWHHGTPRRARATLGREEGRSPA